MHRKQSVSSLTTSVSTYSTKLAFHQPRRASEFLIGSSGTRQSVQTWIDVGGNLLEWLFFHKQITHKKKKYSEGSLQKCSFCWKDKNRNKVRRGKECSSQREEELSAQLSWLFVLLLNTRQQWAWTDWALTDLLCLTATATLSEKLPSGLNKYFIWNSFN